MSETPVPVLRPPGWTLVSASGHPSGWHRIESVNEYSSVRTLCGLRGRAITDSQRAIICCSACQAAEATL